MFKAVIWRLQIRTATGQSTTKFVCILSMLLLYVLERKQNLCLLQFPFHNSLESTENAFNRNQSKNNAEETETHMVLSTSISEKGHFQPQHCHFALHTLLGLVRWQGNFTQQLQQFENQVCHGGQAAVSEHHLLFLHKLLKVKISIPY